MIKYQKQAFEVNKTNFINTVEKCELPEGVASTWRWPENCSPSMDRSPDVPRCDYFVHWKWMNGLNSAEFKIVSPSVSKSWQGMSFSDTSEKVY